MVEPWLRGTLTDLPAVPRQALHALELTREDAVQWCTPLTEAQAYARPGGIAPVVYHLRHIARSLDRLLTYAEGHPLSRAQLATLSGELSPEGTLAQALAELHAGLTHAALRIRTIPVSTYEKARSVGRDLLPTTVGGLIVHCAEHTQRHTGQLVTTAQIVSRS